MYTIEIRAGAEVQYKGMDISRYIPEAQQVVARWVPRAWAFEYQEGKQIFRVAPEACTVIEKPE